MRTSDGRLSAAQRRRVWRVARRTQRRLVAGRIGRYRGGPLDEKSRLAMPASRLVRTATGEAAPDGGFALLRRTGFIPAVHIAAVPSRR